MSWDELVRDRNRGRATSKLSVSIQRFLKKRAVGRDGASLSASLTAAFSVSKGSSDLFNLLENRLRINYLHMLGVGT